MREESDPKATPVDSVLQELQRTLKITQPLTVLDVETTGIDTKRDRVVQVAFSTVTPNGEVTNRNRLINPEEPIPAEATAVNGIKDSHVASAPTFQQIARSLAQKLTGHDFVAYNHRFDREILTAEFERASVPTPFKDAPWIDPMRLWNEPAPHKLGHAFQRFTGSPPDESRTHDGSYDVYMAAEVLARQLREPFGSDRLPLFVKGLAKLTIEPHPSWLDAEGTLMWHGGRPTLRTGKYGGKTLQEVLETDPSYLEWMADDRSTFPDDVTTIISNALTGEFPEYGSKPLRPSRNPHFPAVKPTSKRQCNKRAAWIECKRCGYYLGDYSDANTNYAYRAKFSDTDPPMACDTPRDELSKLTVLWSWNGDS